MIQAFKAIMGALKCFQAKQYKESKARKQLAKEMRENANRLKGIQRHLGMQPPPSPDRPVEDEGDSEPKEFEDPFAGYTTDQGQTSGVSVPPQYSQPPQFSQLPQQFF